MRRMAFLDLAAPRDIDTAFGQEELVTLINLDTLQGIVEGNRREREELVERSKDVIVQGVRETQEWVFQSRMDETIASLQQRCGVIVEDSFTYLDRKMEMNEREKKILKKVLNAPTLQLSKSQLATADFGDFQSFGQFYISEAKQGSKRFAMVQVSVSYTKTSITYTLTFDEEMKLAGFYIK